MISPTRQYKESVWPYSDGSGHEFEIGVSVYEDKYDSTIITISTFGGLIEIKASAWNAVSTSIRRGLAAVEPPEKEPF